MKQNQKINYQRVLEQELEEVSKQKAVPRLLLHSCCAPCSSYVLEYLSEYMEITVFYYNPNIYPEQEYSMRVCEAGIDPEAGVGASYFVYRGRI